MEDKTKKIQSVVEKLSKDKPWQYDLYREMNDDKHSVFCVNWTNDNPTHWLDHYGKDKDKFALFIGGGQTIFTEDKAGRTRSKREDYDLKVTKENAQDIICILEAFLKVQEEEVA